MRQSGGAGRDQGPASTLSLHVRHRGNLGHGLTEGREEARRVHRGSTIATRSRLLRRETVHLRSGEGL